ncbi:MAG: methionine adenosyltransferase [Desulfuromonadales bacterium]|nr:methionine adenosyltransferase [Desulfuromonadales bacterium]
MRMIVEQLPGLPLAQRPMEIVERKGKGHPDTICDAVAEAICVALSAVYLEELGAVLHHNIDKALLVAGRVNKWFGGGELLQPMELIIGDRATTEAEGKKIPVDDIAVDAARRWLRENLRFVDPERDIDFRVVLAPGSAELTDIFSRSGGVSGANDTSAAVGYYPLSPTEMTVLKLEHWLNSTTFKEAYPETGEDVKVMGYRRGSDLELMVAMPLLARLIDSEADYFARKEQIIKEITEFSHGLARFEKTEVELNALDVKGRGLGGVYLSLLGTSAEEADSGQVGRGNRVNGLIAVARPIGTEAVAGKNPVSHVGKIYNVLAHRAARSIYEKIEGVQEVYVFLGSRIGSPIDRPSLAAIQLVSHPQIALAHIAPRAEEILGEELASIGQLCRDLARGKITIC